MQTNPAAEQSTIVRWSDSPCTQSGRNVCVSVHAELKRLPLRKIHEYKCVMVKSKVLKLW